MNLCTVCQKPSTGSANVMASAGSSVTSRWEERCDEHNPYSMTDITTDQQQTPTPASDARLSAEQETEIRGFAASGNLFPPPVRRSSVTALLSELDTLRADAARLREALEAPAGVCRLCRGMVDPQFGGHYRHCPLAAAATPPAPDAGAGSGKQ